MLTSPGSITEFEQSGPTPTAQLFQRTSPLTKCMIRAETTSDTMWAADLTREMTSGPALSFKDIKERLEAKGAKGAGKAERGAKPPTKP